MIYFLKILVFDHEFVWSSGTVQVIWSWRSFSWKIVMPPYDEIASAFCPFTMQSLGPRFLPERCFRRLSSKILWPKRCLTAFSFSPLAQATKSLETSHMGQHGVHKSNGIILPKKYRNKVHCCLFSRLICWRLQNGGLAFEHGSYSYQTWSGGLKC